MNALIFKQIVLFQKYFHLDPFLTQSENLCLPLPPPAAVLLLLTSLSPATALLPIITVGGGGRCRRGSGVPLELSMGALLSGRPSLEAEAEEQHGRGRRPSEEI